MKSFLLSCSVLIALSFGAPVFGQAPAAEPAAEPAASGGPRTVAALGEPGDYQVPLDQIIRISPDVIAGGSIKVKVTGPIKQSRRVTIAQLPQGGGTPLIGQLLEEFEFKSSEPGKATITVTKALPTSDTPEKQVYNITIIVNQDR